MLDALKIESIFSLDGQSQRAFKRLLTSGRVRRPKLHLLPPSILSITDTLIPRYDDANDQQVREILPNFAVRKTNLHASVSCFAPSSR